MLNIMNNVKPPIIDNSTSNTINIPLFGRLHFIHDRDGQMFLCCVLAYWVLGVFPMCYILLWPAYEDGNIPLIVVYGYYAVAALCLLSLLRSSFTNPGRVPTYDPAKHKGWCMCGKCGKMRPPRAHHCRRCKQCVTRMDHHCPWINNCVGESNHFAFLQLLIYAFLLGVYAFVLLMFHFFVFPKCVACDKETFFIKHGIWFMYLENLLSINIIFVMGHMFFQQHVNLIVNQTTLESMMKRPDFESFTARNTYYAYRDLCGQGSIFFWWSPIGRRRAYIPISSEHIV